MFLDLSRIQPKVIRVESGAWIRPNVFWPGFWIRSDVRSGSWIYPNIRWSGSWSWPYANGYDPHVIHGSVHLTGSGIWIRIRTNANRSEFWIRSNVSGSGSNVLQKTNDKNLIILIVLPQFRLRNEIVQT